MKQAPARAQVIARLRELEQSDTDGLPRRSAKARETLASSASRASAESIEARTESPDTRPLDVGALSLAQLREALAGCRRCRLCEQRAQVVYGDGPTRARLMFIGEAPGSTEDQMGVPFVGRAGQLLTDMIEKGMEMRRADVYIANVVKCRPPGNRDPLPDEIAACGGFLARQVELVQPEVIVTLGRFAAQTLLQTTTAISALRGRWHEYRSVAVMPTFHPAYLLRNPAEKRSTWADLKQVVARLARPDSK